MSIDALFRELEPPHGGAERFAQRLDEVAASRPPLSARALAVAAAIAVVALVGVLLVLRQPGGGAPTLVADAPPAIDVFNAPELDRLLGRPAPRAELVVVVDTQPANVTEIETTNQKIRIYQID